jgi:glutamate dehydrogenase (NAD(P)+)
MSRLISITQPDLRGYLAIDSTVNGSSAGGLRMALDLSPELMTRIARVMTLKYGFCGLPVGGAKAGIVADPEMPLDKKRQLLKCFGQALEPFIKSRSYIPAEDLGTSAGDIKFMLNSIGFKAQARGLTFAMSGSYTGITVFTAAVAAARHIGLDLKRASVTIEGFGNVGSAAARMFWERGIRVVAISTSQGAIFDEAGLDIGKLLKLRDQVGSQVVNSFEKAEKIDKSRLLELEVDILSPCAQSYSINPDNASRVAARIISPGANVPIAAEAEPALLQRKILAIPDFVANCGGVLGASMKRAGLQEVYIQRFLEDKIGQQVSGIIEAAEQAGAPLETYARRIAEERFEKARSSAEGKSLAARAFGLALELYRKGVIPHRWVTPLAPSYFEKRFKQ